MKNNPLFTFKSGTSIGVFNTPNNSLIFINDLLGKSKIIIKKDNQNISEQSTISDFLAGGNYSELHFNTGLSKIKQSGKVGYRLLSSESSKYNKIGVGAVDFTSPSDEADVKVGASGNNSFSEGKGNISSGDGSHTEGGHNKASGLSSHAEGFGNIASGYMAHAEGSGTLAAGTMSHTSGFKTQALEKVLDTEIYEHSQELVNQFDKRVKLINVFFGGIELQPINLNDGESICCGIYDLSKNVKLYMCDMDGNILASDQEHDKRAEWMYIISYTNNTGSSQKVKFYFNNNTDFSNDVYAPLIISSLGQYMYIYISKTNIIDYDTVVEEFDLTYTQVEDRRTIGNIASGFETISLGNVSHAEGWKTCSSGGYGSHAEGYLTTAIGAISHSEGYQTFAIGVLSHSEGVLTQTVGDASHAEGLFTKSFGNFSHAEGYNTKAIGDASHSEGGLTQALGDGSHAEGTGTIAQNRSSHASGQYNVGTSTKTICEVGIGDGSDQNKRKNGFEIYTDGSVVAPELKAALINSQPKSLITREYADEYYLGASVSIQDNEFTAAADQTNFVCTGKVFGTTLVESFTNGIRDRKSLYNVTNDGTDTTISFTNGKSAGDMVVLVIYITFGH